MRETKAVLKNNNESECGLIKTSTYGNVDWMLLMFDLAWGELQNPLEERMPLHGFLHKAASPTFREPCWALNPACTLALDAGREHRLIWMKNQFILQAETRFSHPRDWKQRLRAALFHLCSSPGSSARCPVVAAAPRCHIWLWVLCGCSQSGCCSLGISGSPS